MFTAAFDLPTEGLRDLSEVPKNLVFDARSLFSESKEKVSISCLKKEMKIQYRLLSDILAKTLYVKAGSFDAVTRDRFMLMTAITCNVKINLSNLLFGTPKDMVTPGSRQAKGFTIQICVILKNVPGLELGESRAFPASRVLTAKTVHRYVVINEKVGAEDVTDVTRVNKVPKTKATPKKITAVASVDEPIVKKKRTTKGQRKRMLILGDDDDIVKDQSVEIVDTAEVELASVEDHQLQMLRLVYKKQKLRQQMTVFMMRQWLKDDDKAVEGDQDVGPSDVGEHTADKADESKNWASPGSIHIINRLRLKKTGIDQLNLHSVQLGYLKILQMGNTDPNNTKQENKYEVKPQYEELSKQLIMQHAIIDAMKCMRAIKDRIARPVYQLEIISIILYTRTVYQPGKSSVRDLRSPSAHHSLVVGLFRHNSSVGQSQRGFQSGHQSICQSGSRCMHISPGTAKLKPSLTGHENSAVSLLLIAFPQIHGSRPDVAFLFARQNDAAPTNRNDVAALHQLIPHFLRNNQQLVMLNNPDASVA
ncbi:hypothetical protein F511_25825 [Dorcoceras hygrometricum]|uniref:Uncharacterized protein n=1 Tax=Dorcoceras hygrometricum TaxID=472368 RepID=A0A2Z7C647_9LAMI|nr:hypothetical protein F511_25825 [Dorcoceras hygrometricum]